MVNIDIFRHLKNDSQFFNLDEIWDLRRYLSTEVDNPPDLDTLLYSLQSLPRDEPGELNDSSNGNMDQRSQIMDQHDLSDSDALPLLNPNEVIPLTLPIAPSYKEVQTTGNATEEKIQVGDSVENQDSDKSVIKDEPMSEDELVIKTEPIDTSKADEKESKENEDEDCDVVNGRLTEEELKEGKEEEEERLKKEELKLEVKEENEQRQVKHENEGQEDTALLTPSDFQTPLSSPINVADVDVDASSVSSLMVSPIKLMRLSQSESSQSPEHAVYRIKRDRRKKREPPMIIPPYQPSQQAICENEASSQYPKPPYSYSVLIMLALKNSYRGALRVCDIYSFICYHFPYFRTAPAGWKNSVRHNLSLNNRFEKVDDDDDDDGDGEPKNSTQKKGGLWRYAPDKTKKLVETMKSRSKKDPAGVTLSMSEPHMLERLERGEMKFVVGNPNMEYIEEENYMENDEDGSSDENSMESVPSVTLEAEGQQSLLHEEEEAEAMAQEHVEAQYPLADHGHQDESHEEENGNANQIEVYGQVHATSLPHQVHLHLHEVSPIQKRRRMSNSEPVQNAPVVLQVQENTVRRRIAVRPSGSPSGPQAGPSRLQAGPLGALTSQPVTTAPQYVILNIDKSLL
ncbi:Forkhead box protein N1 [Harpegnathos saltator]|uniref:Forkhead box protein N1 n=2 Tax=Harpegnathos saltator TaxID=610380 RepID=E2C9D9_HARSA|nr:Forkhead box protein N1 [Harpegnathos saltator]